MSERSVAEIIGWDCTPNYVWSGEPGMERTDAAGYVWMIKQHTVDDLLAWLTGQGYAVKPQTILPGNNITVEVWRGVNAVCQRTDRTLLAALEAAVRAVAGES